ncbi:MULTISPECIES: alpha/beta hydrolase fold domain-containing protein [unclassified Chryseobacterium]|uniref:alpha/beta hydrolase n=1 Tax=unclassified Chryseobacterium TaxID=2593645 RepID=UPI00226A7D11|nr:MULTISPECIES: alpha/beta hydrolase fold domain-containing protein [unclassified Chryseobacterium]
MIFNRKHTYISIFFVGTMAFGQVNRPNATPYTTEGTFEKFKKKYPFLTSIERPVPQNIKIDQDVEYKNVNGLSLKADIYYPSDQSKKYPGIAMVHGGGWISGSKENEKFMAMELASRGYVVIAIGYRLADVAKYPAGVEDIETGIDWLKKNYGKYSLNKKKMVVLGESAGAQMATLVGVKKKNKIQAIVNVDGIVSFIHPEAEESTYAAYWLGGDRENNLKNWKEASPLEYVDKNTPPTLFINSSQPRFHAGRDDMMKKLKSYNIPTEFHEIKDSPHSFWSAEPWFTETLNLTVDFLNKVLK